MSVITAAAPSQPETLDGQLYEIVYGEIKEKDVGTRQNLIASRLTRLLTLVDPTEAYGRAVLENLFVLDAERELTRRPDFAFVSRERWPQLPPDTNAWNVVPDWVAEIISPSNAADDVITKVDEYLLAGTRSVWVIYPGAQRLYVYTSPTEVKVYEPADVLTGDPVLPEFRLKVADLFADIVVPASNGG